MLVTCTKGKTGITLVHIAVRVPLIHIERKVFCDDAILVY